MNCKSLNDITKNTIELTDVNYNNGVMFLEIIIANKFNQESIDSILFDVEFIRGRTIGIELETGNVYYAYNPFVHIFHENRRLNTDIKRILKKLNS